MKQSFDFGQELSRGCQLLGLDQPDEVALERLHTYFSELKKWSRKVNLIAKGTSDREIVEKHFLDSLTLLPSITGAKPHLLDIGTGAGFPGLVCKAAEESLRVTLVEPRLKRVLFLRHIIRTLGLSNVTVLECRAEDEQLVAGANQFSHITSRAVTEIKPFLHLCEPLAGPSTQVVCMKGPKWQEELEKYQNAEDGLPFAYSSRSEYILPVSSSTRNIMIFDTTHW